MFVNRCQVKSDPESDEMLHVFLFFSDFNSSYKQSHALLMNLITLFFPFRLYNGDIKDEHFPGLPFVVDFLSS